MRARRGGHLLPGHELLEAAVFGVARGSNGRRRKWPENYGTEKERT
jgi:hypothetical protein